MTIIEDAANALRAYMKGGAMSISPPIVGKLAKWGVFQNSSTEPIGRDFAGHVLMVYDVWKHYDSQHPDVWTSGEWYPAIAHKGGEMEIMRSKGRGKQAGQSYLHIRKQVKETIGGAGVETYQTGEYTYWHLRISINDMSWKEI